MTSHDDNADNEGRSLTSDGPTETALAPRTQPGAVDMLSRNRKRPVRRGVLLLVVLSLLVLFLMLGVAFVVTAKQAEKSAKTAMRGATRTSTRASLENLLDATLVQLIRDTNSPNSVIRSHSLLADLYGNDGLRTSVVNASWASADGASDPTGGQMIELRLNLSSVQNQYGDEIDAYGNSFLPGAPRFGPFENAYSGQVLTFVSGAAKGCSARIVGFAPPNRFRVMNFPFPNGTFVNLSALSGSQIVMSGRPFNGTGVGLNLWAKSGEPKLNAAEILSTGQQLPLALAPNAAFFLNSNVVLPVTPPTVLPPNATYFPLGRGGIAVHEYCGTGGSDEPYDAPDYQNMALAYLPESSLQETVLEPHHLTESSAAALPDNLGNMIIPSFHRPDLLNFWALHAAFNATGSSDIRQSGLGTPAGATVLRRALMRPNWLDHPDFTGSNPEFAAITGSSSDAHGRRLVHMVYGPWDVDNDNDGIRDSVWLDVGLPIVENEDGVMVKPLAAILIVDLDGRLNVNAHGTLDLAGIVDDALTPLEQSASLAGAGMTSDATARGSGYGPAEISLEHALDSTNFQWLMTEKDFGTAVYPGKYGFDGNDPARPGVAQVQDLMAQLAQGGWPQWASGVGALSSFVTPPDLRARYGVGLNSLGQSIFDATLQAAGVSAENLLVDSPYEINLSDRISSGVHGGPGQAMPDDSPFSLAELERVLRLYDVDAGSLPPRLAYLAGVQSPNGGDGDAGRRLKITTESRDVPMPSIAVPAEMDSMFSNDPRYRRLPRSAADLMEARIRRSMGLAPFAEPLDVGSAGMGPNERRVRETLRRLLAPEQAKGHYLNVNRSLGNGRDDTAAGLPGVGVVDEPGESGRVWNVSGGGPFGSSVATFSVPLFPPMATEVIPDAAIEGKAALVDHRQLLARHLYALALTVSADASFGGSLTPSDEEQESCRTIAQWAVNAVDFRDPDNIMTAFEYDVDPFDGWDVDGEIGDVSSGSDKVLGTNDDVPSPDNDAKHRGVVWGCERPELVITETLAWHDRRTDDSLQEDPFPAESDAQLMRTPDFPNDPDADKDFDQLSQPRGALFIELYNPWSPSPGANADIHDRASRPGYDLGVDLGASVGVGAAASPVWRVAVYKRKSTSEEAAAKWDPDHPDAKLRPPIASLDRTIYFTPAPPHDTTDGAAFHNESRNPTPPVRPGRYLVVGGGDEIDEGVYVTPVGDRKDRSRDRPRRRIELVTRRAAQGRAHAVSIIDAEADENIGVIDDQTGLKARSPSDDGSQLPRVPGDDSPVQSMCDVAVINRVTDENRTVERRLSVSEPAGGYPEVFQGSKWDAERDRYMSDETPSALDVPLDGPIGGEAALQRQFGDPENWPSYLAGFDNASRKWFTRLDPVLTSIRSADPSEDKGAYYCHLFLQRLANPLVPWNPAPGHPHYDEARLVNPYLTVDDMPLNLTVFNSRGDDRGREEPDEENSDGKSATDPSNFFASVERGQSRMRQFADSPEAGQFIPSFWHTEPPNLEQPRPAAIAEDRLFVAQNPPAYWKMQLKRRDDYWFNAVPFCSLGFLNRSFQAPDVAKAEEERKTKPSRPFEWLTWNNRPYVSGNELLLVPHLRSSQLLREFSNAETPIDDWNEYQLPPANPPEVRPGPQKLMPFKHLPSFFYGQDESQASQPSTPLKLGRVLEYIQTPSLFNRSGTRLNPLMASFNGNLDQSTAATDPGLLYQPPDNTVSDFRDPGAINLNTLPGNDAWFGLFHGGPDPMGSNPDVHPGPSYEEFAKSRRGYDGARSLTLNAAYPTVFANPFRPRDSADLAPIASMRRAGVDVTLLRSSLGTSGSSAKPNGNPLFSAATSEAYNDAKRNPYFRYQPIIRLDNLTTTRSNVYAVWITIGFFEVEQAAPFSEVQSIMNGDVNLYRRVYPEGWQFGREAGLDHGDPQRIRGFYILDRTIPVAFEPGIDHNSSDIVRLRRRLQ
jgi:hypothetical protein